MKRVEQALCEPAGPQEVVVFSGIPGSGKSTLYRRLFAATHAHISLDILHKRSQERRMLEEQLAAGRSTVIDNTNVRRTERAVYLTIAERFEAPVRCIHLLIDLRDALRRNAGRQGRARIPNVGVIAKHKALEIPLLEEGFVRIQRIRVHEDGAIELEQDLQARG